MVNVPLAAVLFWLRTLVAWLTTVTKASGTAPPLVSRTVPVTVAVGVWASATAASQEKSENKILQGLRIPHLKKDSLAIN